MVNITRHYGDGIATLLSELKTGPQRKAEARLRFGSGQIHRLLKSGVLSEFIGDDPHYLLGTPGKKPMCMWLELGEKQYTPKMQRVRVNSKNDKRIAVAISLLATHGYKVCFPTSVKVEK